MESVSDDDLMRMYCNGDADAFDTLFDRHYTSVYNFARTMLGEAAGPEEVLQETFLAVARSARQYSPRGRFRSWLMRIVRNRCLNRIVVQVQHRDASTLATESSGDGRADAPGPSRYDHNLILKHDAYPLSG